MCIYVSYEKRYNNSVLKRNIAYIYAYICSERKSAHKKALMLTRNIHQCFASQKAMPFSDSHNRPHR